MRAVTRMSIGLFVLLSTVGLGARAQADCGVMSYTCTGGVSFSGTEVLNDYDAGLPLDRTCFGTAYYHRNPNGPLDGLVMVLAGRNLAEPGMHRLCFGWAMGRALKAPRVSASVSNENCFLLKDGTSSQITASGDHGALNCTVKVHIE